MAVRGDSRRLGSGRVAGFALAAILSVTSLLVATAQDATPSASPAASQRAALPPAWLEFGPEGQLLARVIVDGPCPTLDIDGRSATMIPRTSPSDDFAVVACEATVPFGAETAAVGDRSLPLPAGPIERIAVIGDTGCRLNDWEKKFQNCNDPQAWPFAQVASAVAAWEPDLIVHVGDYLYRESPCPAGEAGCAGSPYGDNWPTWNADFFAPAAPLLGVAPWVFMRGNHETSDRNASGWFTYLDPRPYDATCQRFTEPYVLTLPGLVLAAIDSAEASDTKTPPEEDAEYARQFSLLGTMAPPGAWLVTHRPVWGILEGQSGEIQVENAVYEAATGGSLQANYGLVLSGHIHLAETLAFDEASERPPQVVSGNSGTALDDVPTASPTAGQLGDAAITEAETLSAFGFLTLEPDGADWIATQRGADGSPLRGCRLDLPEMSCQASDD